MCFPAVESTPLNATLQQSTPLARSFAESRTIEGVALVRFFWSVDRGKCRVIAYDAVGHTLGEVVIELPEQTHRRIAAIRAGSAQIRIEEIAERHLRAMLDLRY